MRLRFPHEELMLWAECQIKAEPGIWTARLCRSLNGLGETEADIIHCGLCADYANPRKRDRAARLAELPTLPGLDAPFQLHPPCKAVPLRKLRYLLDVLEHQCDLVYSVPLSEIPDCRQARGVDYATRYYPND